MNWRNFLIIGAGFLLSLILFAPEESSAHSKETYEVSNQILNVREAPSDSAEIIGTLSKNDTITAFQEKYGWVQTYFGGEEAWVAKHYLVSTSSGNSHGQSYTDSITIQKNGVRVRTGPSTNNQIIDIAASGDTYQMTGTEGDWHQVVMGNGTTGWIASWLTDMPASSSGVAHESVPTTKISSNGSLSGLHIVVDPGHGGKDSGAIGLNGVYEKNLVSSTADYVAQELRDAGAAVTLTRNGDYFVSLNERTNISNRQGADAFISLHYNSFPMLAASGTRTYYSNNGKSLAQQVQGSLASHLPLRNGGIHHGDYRVLNHTTAPAVLVELGFLSNPNDLQEVQTSYYQSNAAKALTSGLKNYFN
ncbi:N-acetylmuramoyl-L-alanine amidase [Virgibacillus xinjiangensis]|uniref:N-acetylmuramoyl-L-alanine amidase n=1 Tax=Virgibacillus xinjiangensis TaxID=393090 RepID=A0ABV7CY17_9BACI